MTVGRTSSVKNIIGRSWRKAVFIRCLEKGCSFHMYLNRRACKAVKLGLLKDANSLFFSLRLFYPRELCKLGFEFDLLWQLKLSFSLISGLVPLHNACSYGHYEVAELLVRHGASVNVADLWKFTPLHEAAAKGKYEICKLLLKVSHLQLPNVFLNVCSVIFKIWNKDHFIIFQ